MNKYWVKGSHFLTPLPAENKPLFNLQVDILLSVKCFDHLTRLWPKPKISKHMNIKFQLNASSKSINRSIPGEWLLWCIASHQDYILQLPLYGRPYQSKVVWAHDWWSRNRSLWLSLSIHGGRLLGLFLPFLQKLRVLGHRQRYWTGDNCAN